MVSFSLKELAEKYPVKYEWRSYELRPTGAPPVSPEYQAKLDLMWPRFNAMIKEQHDIEINMGVYENKRGNINGVSRRSLIGAKYAEEQGKGEVYHDAMFSAFWMEAKSIGEDEVLAEVAEGIGLNRGDFIEALNDESYNVKVAEDIMKAYQYGLNVVPAMVIEGKYLVTGAQPYFVLSGVVEKIISGDVD